MLPEESANNFAEVQETSTRGRGKSHLGYWKTRIYRNSYTVRGEQRRVRHWCVKLAKGGRREMFGLGTADASEAAKKAREIALLLDVQGWEAARAKFKAEGRPAADQWTISEVIATAGARSTLRPRTLAFYAGSLRLIAADLAGIARAGRGPWVDRAAKVSLSALSATKVTEWRAKYVGAAGTDPLKRKSAERSAATYIRNARALFKIPGMPPSPFQGLRLKGAAGKRYQSTVDPAVLVAAARAELQRSEPQQYLAFLLCFWGGLRKREADLLIWDQVDQAAAQIRLRRSKYFDPKTEESERDVDVPAPVLAEIAAFRGEKEFVLKGTAARPKASYAHYRAETTWKKLGAWLRSKGITEQKAVHTLRKESGSLIAQAFDIEAARAHLGHRDIQTTSAHYVTKKERREVTLTP